MSLITAISTVVVGVTIFLIGQLLLKLMLEPVVSVRRTIADTSSTVLFYQAKITNANRDDQIADELRKLSSRLRADVYGVLWYRLGVSLRLVPAEHDVREACRELNLLAYGMQSSYDAGAVSQEAQSSATQNCCSLKKLGDFLKTKTSY